MEKDRLEPFGEGKEHYFFENYAYPGRWKSYFFQIREVIASQPRKLLEIGVGDGVFRSYIKNNTAIHYEGLDISAELRPDYVADLLRMPFPDDSFDTVCAFQVLEHLPFEGLDDALRELRRVAKKTVIISLPHFCASFSFAIKIPLVREIRWTIKIPFPKRHNVRDGHYWEIGKKSFSRRRIRNILNEFFQVKKEFSPFGNPYHRFYVLEKIK